jgi:hypothetical protein
MPVIQFYVDRHMDFVALKLRPGQGVQAMQPVRVQYSSANMVLPLHMVSAGVADKVGITLWVFGSGRYDVANAGNGQVDPNEVVWDWTATPPRANYAQLFESTIQSLGGGAWLTEYAQRTARFPMYLFRSDSTGGHDWMLATQNGGTYLTRLRSDLAISFLANDLQLEASMNTADVSNVINAQRSIGMAPGTGCSTIEDIPRDDDIVRKPTRTILAAIASALALIAIRRRSRRGGSDA